MSPRVLTTVPTLALAALLLAACGGAGDPDLRVVGTPQAAVPVSGSSQVVVTLANDGDGDDELVEATTEAALGVEIHLTEIDDDGRATMRQLESVEIAAGDEARFRPGGLHLMLVVPDATVTEGGTFTLTLHFDRSDDLHVDVEVVPLLDLAEDAEPEPDDDA